MAKRKKRSSDQMDFKFQESDKPDKKTKKRSSGTASKSRKKPQSKSARQKQTNRSKKSSSGKSRSPRRRAKVGTAESMAADQRSISISEFFAKNRHLLGFDNPRKALLTTVKEAVDNSLDACEEARILPELTVEIKQIAEEKFILTITDNGPGILKKQIPNIFARLLYGSKFHRLRMSRGQQGIGISAAGMYGLLTTGQPVRIVSRTNSKKNAHRYHVQVDTAKNKPHIVLDEECDFDLPTGTRVSITLEGRYQRGKQSVEEYINQTAMANPHATIRYYAPDGKVYEYERRTDENPFVPQEIKPHPYGIEVGLLYKMAKDSSYKQLSAFLKNEFSRVSGKIANRICEKADLKPTLNPSRVTIKHAERIHAAINDTKIMSPPTNCIGPIGEDKLTEGLKRVVDADFYAASSRNPAVYRGNPFLVEAALAYGFKDSNGSDSDKEPLMRLIRIANRVPLLYQQSAGAIYKAVLDTNWRNYSLSQSKGALPTGPVVLMVHIASVWVPFTSESKEAIAHYPEIIKEIQLAVQECGRKLGRYLRKQKRIRHEESKRHYIETYLPYIGEALQEILELKDNQVNGIIERLDKVLDKSRKI